MPLQPLQAPTFSGWEDIKEGMVELAPMTFAGGCTGGIGASAARQIGLAAVLDSLRAAAAADTVGRLRCMGALERR